MRTLFVSALIFLRYAFPPITAALALWLLETTAWPIQMTCFFLVFYNALLYCTQNLVFTPRLKPFLCWYNFLPIIILAGLASWYLGMIGETIGVGTLAFLMADLHICHMVYFGCTDKSMMKDALFFTTTPLGIGLIFFGFSFSLLVVVLGYCLYIFSLASKRYSSLPKLRRLS